eukprot:TRINITY_DN6083_c0_g1_i1.p1 TRINITY_DN6083_c0_g1~~TRINITY_DN6083_c0_g1_i1.p1  ORF type:complete len:440 (+),score=85.24 TRINITY_DN6083_c0_g1_i1:117-1436(+)
MHNRKRKRDAGCDAERPARRQRGVHSTHAHLVHVTPLDGGSVAAAVAPFPALQQVLILDAVLTMAGDVLARPYDAAVRASRVPPVLAGCAAFPAMGFEAAGPDPCVQRLPFDMALNEVNGMYAEARATAVDLFASGAGFPRGHAAPTAGFRDLLLRYSQNAARDAARMKIPLTNAKALALWEEGHAFLPSLGLAGDPSSAGHLAYASRDAAAGSAAYARLLLAARPVGFEVVIAGAWAGGGPAAPTPAAFPEGGHGTPGAVRGHSPPASPWDVFHGDGDGEHEGGAAGMCRAGALVLHKTSLTEAAAAAKQLGFSMFFARHRPGGEEGSAILVHPRFATAAEVRNEHAGDGGCVLGVRLFPGCPVLAVIHRPGPALLPLIPPLAVVCAAARLPQAAVMAQGAGVVVQALRRLPVKAVVKAVAGGAHPHALRLRLSAAGF